MDEIKGAPPDNAIPNFLPEGLSPSFPIEWAKSDIRIEDESHVTQKESTTMDDNKVGAPPDNAIPSRVKPDKYVRECEVPCPKCSKPVPRKIFIDMFGRIDRVSSEAICECESCGNRFNTTATQRTINTRLVGGELFRFDVEGHDYPVVYRRYANPEQDPHLITGKDALEFIKDHGVDEIEYFCPYCFTTHKGSINKILKELDVDFFEFNVVCPNTRRVPRIAIELIRTRRIFHVVYTLTDLLNPDNCRDHPSLNEYSTCGLVRVSSSIPYIPDIDSPELRKNKSVKKMNFM